MALRKEFNLSIISVTWVVTAFYIASASIQPLLGRVADRRGPRRMFLVGMGVIVSGSVLAATASSWVTICAARVVIAIGTSSAFPATIALINRDASPAAQLRMLGRVQLSGNLGIAIGPAVGGLLLGWLGWRAVFVASIPLALVAAIGVVRVVMPDGVHPDNNLRQALGFARHVQELDVVGVLLLAIGLTTGVLAVQGSGPAPRAVNAVVAIFAAALFVRSELRQTNPVVDLRLLAANPVLARLCPAWLLICLFYYTVLYGLPQVLEDVGGLRPSAVGLALAPLAIVSAAVTPAGVWTMERMTTRWVVRAGAVLSLVACLVSTAVNLSTTFWVGVVVACALGISNGVVTIATSQRMFESTARGAVGASAGLFQSLRYFGAIVAACVLSLTFEGRATLPDWNMAAGVSAVACLLAVRLVSSRR